MCVFEGAVEAYWEREVPQSVIINLSGMQLQLLPDKLLHGYVGLAGCHVALASPQISAPGPPCTHAHTRTGRVASTSVP